MFSPILTKGLFKFVDQRHIGMLNVELQQYQHEITGAKHYHIACDDSNKIFMVALRTLPEDSTGVAHILEHIVLCGSKNYPVRDPFFLMLRRSLSNFMNAFTASDWTAYPFATQNSKDFDNLLNVYLDAVFFPNLDKFDFMQEGWRLDVAKQNKENTLLYKGVVFNEMKGAMSSPIRQLWHHACKHLFAHGTYHFNSGGEPLDIPSLTHDQLLAFHQCYYHPSNAVFFSYVDVKVHEVQEKINSLVLKHFEKNSNIPKLMNETPFTQPKSVEEYYPIDKNHPNKTHIVLAWLLGDSLNLSHLLETTLLNLLLFDNSASPMQKLLENTDLGTTPSPINGLEDEMKEMVMCIGLEGCKENDQQKVTDLIMHELERLMNEGVPASQVDACMHQLELSQRDISGGSVPGLNLILSLTLPAIHGTDITEHLDTEEGLKKLRKKSQNPQFIKSLIARLYNNQHRICLSMKPDETLGAKWKQFEQKQLKQWQDKFDVQELQEIAKQNKQLEVRQLQPQNVDLLPTISVQDIKPECDFTEPYQQDSQRTIYQTRCNGLVYVNALLELPNLTQKQSTLLPVMSHLLTEVGHDSKSYTETQEDISRYTGGVSVAAQVWQPLQNCSTVQRNMNIRMIASGSGLAVNGDKLLHLMSETLQKPRFDEKQHIKEIIAQMASASFYGIASKGHLLAMQAASSQLSFLANVGFEWSGLQSIKRLLELNNSIQDDVQYDQFIGEMSDLFQRLSERWRSHWLLIADTANSDTLQSNWGEQIPHRWSMETSYKQADVNNTSILTETYKNVNKNVVWSIETTVNYCAAAYHAVDFDHPHSAIFNVLSHYLRNIYLHTSIREQGGAYGGGCQYDSRSATLRFFSYRDPRLHETYEDFERSIKHTLNKKIKQRDLQEAIFNAVAKIDIPLSTPDRAMNDFYSSLKNIDKKFLESYKQSVLDVSTKDLLDVVQEYLLDKPVAKSLITGHQQAQKLVEQGYTHFMIKT